MAVRTHDLRALRPEVHVLVPFTLEGGDPSSPEYDTPEFRSELASWFEPIGLSWTWVPVTLPALPQIVADLKARAARCAVIAVNLCDGFDTDGYPGPSVIDALSAAGLAYTGGGPSFYRTSSSKLEMKARFRAAGVATASWHPLTDPAPDVGGIAAAVGYPAIIKLSGSSAGGGLDRSSVVADEAAARARVQFLTEAGHAPLGIFAERFLAGREATVFVRDTPWRGEGIAALPAVEMVYNPQVPVNERILFEGHRYVGLDGRPRAPDAPARCTYATAPDVVQDALQATALAAYRAVGGDGYARVDLRFDPETGMVNALEVNTNPELSRVAPTVAPALAAAGLSFEALVEDLLTAGLLRARTIASAQA